MDLAKELGNVVEGDVSCEEDVLDEHAQDTSLFRVVPEVVVFPKNTNDIKNIVRFVNEHKNEDQKLSITSRSAGTDMSGGPLNESIILSFTRYFTGTKINNKMLAASVEPGVFYKDFESKTLPKHIYMPAYPASKGIAAFGGMIMNNCGGEKTLKYGQMRNFVDELSMVLSDGNEYTFRKLNRDELEEKKNLPNFEGEIYRKTHELLENNFDAIQKARPVVSKNSAGYALWDVWNREHFDLTQLFTGSQGTLGVLTHAKIRLVRDKPHKKLVVLFFKNWDVLPDVVNALLPVGPESLEAFDDETLKLGLRFMPGIAKKVGESFLSFATRFLPEVFIGIRMFGLPKLIVLVELVEDSERVVEQKVRQIENVTADFHLQHRVAKNGPDSEKYWIMRRESFNLLRKSVRGKKTAPFIDDFCVLPKKIPEFLPKLLQILKDHNIRANIAGHAGSGNFHIIPLMNLRDPEEREKIPAVSDLVYDLIISYGGSITAEHNDGIIRTPYLEKMYGPDVYSLFKDIKNIFDPAGIFNPGKKVGGDLKFMKEHIARE